MKNFKFLYIVFLGLLFSNCEDELNIEPQSSITDVVALSTEGGISNVLVGLYDEAHGSSTFNGYKTLLSDLLGTSNQVDWVGTFSQPVEFFNKKMLPDNGFVGSVWSGAYQIINQANLVIENSDVVTSSETKKDRLIGEAKFLRAFSYFELINSYALPYTSGQTNSQMGVPLRLSGIVDFSVDLSLIRSSVEEVYAQIILDLDDAYSKLPPTNGFFADKYAAKALLARLYLQQGNYAAARDAAHDVIENSGHQITGTFAEAFNRDSDSSEDIFAIQFSSTDPSFNAIPFFYASAANGGRGGDIPILPGYIDLFDAPALDVRASFFYIDNEKTLTSKYVRTEINLSMFRMAEMHLIRGESNFRENTTVGLPPLDEINALRARSLAPPFGVVTLDSFLNERQLELGFEGLLLQDFKRTGRSIGSIPFDDNRLVWPIPEDEINTNALIEQNP